ncbi:MAG: hypothetical protein WCS96_14645, partial [Victivallales bacterium]
FRYAPRKHHDNQSKIFASKCQSYFFTAPKGGKFFRSGKINKEFSATSKKKKDCCHVKSRKHGIERA